MRRYSPSGRNSLARLETMPRACTRMAPRDSIANGRRTKSAASFQRFAGRGRSISGSRPLISVWVWCGACIERLYTGSRYDMKPAIQ